MSLNLFTEELNRAYKNNGLLASDVWNYKKYGTDFQKANLQLWVRFNDIEKRLADEESEDELSTSTEEVFRTVRDTIPLSRLASYGDYVYNEKRENMYVSDDGPAQYKPIKPCSNSNQNGLEVWMLPEVEDQFKKLTDVSSYRWSMFSPGERHIDPKPPLDPAYLVTRANPCQWLSNNTWPDQLISHYPKLPCALQGNKTSLFNSATIIQPKFSEAELEEKLEEFPCPRYMIRTNEDLELHMRINSDAVRSLWDDQECSLDEDQQQGSPNYAPSLLHYPSIYDTSYEAELFPYSNPGALNNVQSGFESSTVYSEEDNTIYNVPVFVESPASYFNLEYKEEALNSYLQLPISEQPSYFMVVPDQMDSAPNLFTIIATIPSYNLQTLNVRKPQEVLDYLEKLLSKIYNPRVDDLRTIQHASGKISKTFQNIQHNYCLIQETPPSSREQRPSQKPLYSDVLMNDAGSLSYNDSRYDELEREAVEQYSHSVSDTNQLGNLSTPLSPYHVHDLTQEDKTVFSEIDSISPELSQSAKKESRRRVRLDDFSPRPERCTSQSSLSSKYSESPTPCLKKPKNISSLWRDSCIPNKQAQWMEKKKKKLERKQKLLKRNKIQCNKQPAELVEYEIFLISAFLELSNKFLKGFFLNNSWKAVVSLLEENAFGAFEECLKIINDCLHWFKLLNMSKELKKDFLTYKKRLDITNNVLKILSDLFGLLQQYINRCSIIKSTVLFDHCLYFDSNGSIRLPLAFCDQVVNKFFDEETYFTRILNVDTILSGKVSKRFDVAKDGQITNRCEWKLKLKYDKLWKTNYTCVRLINHSKVFDFVLESTNEPSCINTSHNKMLKIVDDFQIWSEWQWTFMDGWMFSTDCLHYNFNWLNKFNVKSLEYSMSFVRKIFFLKNWISYSTEAFFSNKHCCPQCQLLWNPNCFDLTNTKTAFLKILLQEGKTWQFGVMWISKEPCNPLEPFCENSCCIGWNLIDFRNSRTVKERLTSKKTFQTRTASLQIPKQKRDEVKIKRYAGLTTSKTSDRMSKLIDLNKMMDAKIKLREEKHQSLCTLQ